jgi:hypothetical protein
LSGSDADTAPRTTQSRQVRVADGAWQAYDQVCRRLGRTRAADILQHIRHMIETHGTAEERALLAAADAEVAERRARRGRRPRRATGLEKLPRN